MPSWTLGNADELAAEFKYTFYKPGPEIIGKIAAGDVVKLIFRFESDDPEAPAAERMWVEVDEVTGDGGFRGRLTNLPKHIKNLKPDDTVEFRACHIISTPHDDDDNIVERYIKRCFVTNRVMKDGRPVGYIYREVPDGEEDSGWRITANDESEEYMDDAKNFAYVSLGAVLNKDDGFVDLLDSPEGSAFALDPQTGQFVPV
ncbi:MAG TPA: DUF2185 domain-containing protein [Burkholderiales bacterium]|jgi:hypothetical protein|nr:DUF2185 domain-containing protein [Burkholderiales bacterium]